jgi:hypothetical protein
MAAGSEAIMPLLQAVTRQEETRLQGSSSSSSSSSSSWLRLAACLCSKGARPVCSGRRCPRSPAAPVAASALAQSAAAVWRCSRAAGMTYWGRRAAAAAVGGQGMHPQRFLPAGRPHSPLPAPVCCGLGAQPVLVTACCCCCRWHQPGGATGQRQKQRLRKRCPIAAQQAAGRAMIAARLGARCRLAATGSG